MLKQLPTAFCGQGRSNHLQSYLLMKGQYAYLFMLAWTVLLDTYI